MRHPTGARTSVTIFLSLLTATAGLAQETTRPALPALLDNRTATNLLMTQKKPDYPPVAKMNYIQGQVRLQIVVTPQGRVSKAHVITGEALLAAAALDAVHRWRYRPYLGPDGPQGFQTLVHFNFNLRFRTLGRFPAHPDKDLARQVRPPVVLSGPVRSVAQVSVQLRVLVGKDGRVLDSEIISGPSAELASARQALRGWKFRPARWGTLAIPWYLEVEVPVRVNRGERGRGDSSGR